MSEDDKVFSFTMKRLQLLSLPARGRVTYRDSKQRSLILMVHASGVKSFYLYKRINKKPDRIFLGHFPDLSVEAVRDYCAELLVQIAKGIHPKANTTAPVTPAMTFGVLFQHYLEYYAKLHKKTWEEDERQFKRYLIDWSERPLDSIQRSQVMQLHTQIGIEHGYYQANRVLALLKVLFNKATDWELYDKGNPCIRIKYFREQARDRFLQNHELGRFFDALQLEDNHTIRDYFLMLLYTGARRSTALAMRWDEINLVDATWTIPATKQKNGVSQVLPLVSEALELLKARRPSVHSEWVFPARAGSKSGHMTEPKRGWERVCQRAKLSNLRIHDLRRSLGSWQAKQGHSLIIIGKTLNHQSPHSTAIYSRLDIEPVRYAMQDAVKAMRSHLSPSY